MMMKMRMPMMMMMVLILLIILHPPLCRYEAEHSILTAAKLISPVIEETFSLGYNWSVSKISLLARHWVKEKIDSFLGETWGTDLYT